MTSPIPHLGEIVSLLNAMIWATAVILFKISGLNVPPVALNLFKNTIGLICLVLTLIVMGQLIIPNASPIHIGIFLVSGAIGIGLADSLFFASLNILGASRAAIVDCLYSPFITLFAFLMLGETLTPRQGVGAMMIVVGVLLTSLDGSRKELPPRVFWKGSLLGAASMLLMALSIVSVKPLMGLYPVLWSTNVRMIGGMIVLVVFALLHPDGKKIWSVFKPSPVWKYSLPGGFLGAYPAIILWMAGFKYAKANIAGLLTQTSALFTVILAVWILKEPMTRWKFWAVFLAFSGSALVLL